MRVTSLLESKNKTKDKSKNTVAIKSVRIELRRRTSADGIAQILKDWRETHPTTNDLRRRREKRVEA